MYQSSYGKGLRDTCTGIKPLPPNLFPHPLPTPDAHKRTALDRLSLIYLPPNFLPLSVAVSKVLKNPQLPRWIVVFYEYRQLAPFLFNWRRTNNCYQTSNAA